MYASIYDTKVRMAIFQQMIIKNNCKLKTYQAQIFLFIFAKTILSLIRSKKILNKKI
jgi:hypothetical protein